VSWTPGRGLPAEHRLRRIEDGLIEASRRLEGIAAGQAPTSPTADVTEPIADLIVSGGSSSAAGGVPESEVEFTTDGHNHDGSGSATVGLAGDVSGNNTAAVVDKIAGVTAGQIVDTTGAWQPKTTGFTAAATCAKYLCDATGGAFAATLPAAAGCKATLTFKKSDASANAITVTPAAGTIDGAATYALSTQYSTVILASDGTNWFIAGKF
jgi:hypothetical protein